MPLPGPRPIRTWFVLACIGAAIVAAVAPPATSATVAVRTVDVSADPDYGGAEPWISVNPRHPSNVVEMWQTVFTNGGNEASRAFTPVGHFPLDDCRVGYTVDAGRTWHRRWSPLTDAVHSTCGDPITSATAKGTFLVAGLVYVPSTLLGEIRVSRSVDGGRGWSKPINAVSIQNTEDALMHGQLYPIVGPSLFPGTPDREWFAVDASTNTVYLAWVDHTDPTGAVGIGGDRYFVVSSHDDGLTWKNVYPIGPDGQAAYGTIAAAKGTLAAGYSDTSCTCIVFETSPDGGAHWSRHPIPNTVSGSLLSGAVVAADPSRAGRFAVMLPGPQGHYAVRVTADSGRTWSRPLPLDEESPGSAGKGWLAYGPTGVLGAMWRVIHSDSTQDVYAAVAMHGDADFGRPVRLTGPPSMPADPLNGTLDDVSYVTVTATTLWASYGGMTAEGSVRDAWASSYRFRR